MINKKKTSRYNGWVWSNQFPNLRNTGKNDLYSSCLTLDMYCSNGESEGCPWVPEELSRMEKQSLFLSFSFLLSPPSSFTFLFFFDLCFVDIIHNLFACVQAASSLMEECIIHSLCFYWSHRWPNPRLRWVQRLLHDILKSGNHHGFHNKTH